jgi:dolichol-phosphate mannosyltransferase
MDADLQHPPEKVPELIKAVSAPTVFCIGTRYGGSELSVDKDWPLHRRIISWGARLLARPLSPLSDPMTGFFAISAARYRQHRTRISSIGFKVCMESYIKCEVRSTELAEVPILFGARVAGESKLTGKVIISYLKHLQQLYFFKYGTLLLGLLVLVLVLFYLLFLK